MNKKCLIFFNVVLLASFLTSCNQKNAIAKIDATSFNFGIKDINDTIRGAFTVENIGGENLFIKSVGGPCDCTFPAFKKSAIKPGEKSEIKFIYVPKKIDTGAIKKELIVRTNSKKQLEVLTINGRIINNEKKH